MKYIFVDREVRIDINRRVYDEQNRCLGIPVKCDGYEHYLIGSRNKGPIVIKK